MIPPCVAPTARASGDPIVTKLTVNGITYESVNDITVPGFKFHMGSVAPSASQPTGQVGGSDPAQESRAGTPPPNPIEPASSGAGLRTALILGACAAAGLMVWLWMRAR
jgi:hypothetical protein